MATIEEILKNAGVEDQAIIDAVKAETPKHFVPTTTLNERVAAAKKEAADIQAAFDAFKAEADKANEANEGKQSESAQALADLQAKYDKLDGEFKASQDKHKQRAATDALTKALKEAGANPAALELLASAGLAKVEWNDDGEPSNVADVANGIKEKNAGLFGEKFTTGKPQDKGDDPNGAKDDFLAGFGSTDRK